MTTHRAPQSEPQLRLQFTDSPLIGEPQQARLLRVLGLSANLRLAADFPSRTFDDAAYHAATQQVREVERRLGNGANYPTPNALTTPSCTR